jgi:putative oxidoreductase
MPRQSGLAAFDLGALLLQRLFSTFANGWPGIGLLLQRFLTSMALIHWGIHYWREAQRFALVAPHMVGAAAGILLLVGLWTPVVGTLIAVVEILIALSNAGDPWTSVPLATLGATLAMIGPGAWSIDARLFGRKQMQIPER